MADQIMLRIEVSHSGIVDPDDLGQWEVNRNGWTWTGPARVEIIDPALIVRGLMTDVLPCVMSLRDRVSGGPATYHDIHPAMGGVNFEDILEEEEGQEEDPQEDEDQDMELEDEDEFIDVPADDLDDELEEEEADFEEIPMEGPIEWEFDPEEAPAAKSSDEDE